MSLGRASGTRSVDCAAMGGEQKPAHHRLGRGGKKPIVIIGTVVVFFVLLSMTGLGHSHNHVERDMPAHAALSGRRAGRHTPGDIDYARARLHGAHGIRDRHHGALDGATHRVGSGDRADPDRVHDAFFGGAIDDAIETKAKAWMHEVMDPVVETLHDSAEGGIRGGAGAHHRHHGLGHSEGGASSLASSVERAADAVGGLQHSVGGLAHLAHATRDAAHLELSGFAGGAARAADADSAENVGASKTRFGDDPDDVAKNFAALSSGLNPMRGARDGATLNDPRLVWHPPPRADHGADAGTALGFALSTTEDDENKHSISSSVSSGDNASVGALDALDNLDDLDLDAVASVRDDLDESRTGETRVVDRSTAATSGVLLSCERCSHHGVCALGGECQCAAMFEGKACRITRALAPTSETSDPTRLAGSGSRPDPVLAGFARGFGGSMTLTRENAPATLEARPIESDAAARNAGVASEEHLEVEDDWTRRDNNETFETSGSATLSLSRVDDGHPDFHSGSRSDSEALSFARKADGRAGIVGEAESRSAASASSASGEGQNAVSVADDVLDPAPAPPAKFGKITRSTRERLPERGPFDEAVFHRCALVGRGGFHASEEHEVPLGFEVDAHDVVFRFGDDPVVGRENAAGSRTTFRLVVDDQDTNPQSQYMGDALPRVEKGATSVPVTRPEGFAGRDPFGDVSEDDADGSLEKNGDFADLPSFSSRREKKRSEDAPTKTVRFVRDSVSFKRYLAARLAKPESEAHVAHPDFIAWVDGAVSSAFGKSISPELYGALVAAHKCREVNLYGFRTRFFSFAGAEDARPGLLFGSEDDRTTTKTSGRLERDASLTARADGADAVSAASTPSTLDALSPGEWSVLTRMAKAGVLHFAEPCVVECHENAAACDACVADPESGRAARAAVGRSRGAVDAGNAVDDSEKTVGASLDHWMSGVAGAFAHSGFEKAERNGEAFSSDEDASKTASVASTVFARGAGLEEADDVEPTDPFGGDDADAAARDEKLDETSDLKEGSSFGSTSSRGAVGDDDFSATFRSRDDRLKRDTKGVF